MSHPRSRRHLATPSTAASLRRWLCAWLALLSVTQMLGSTLSGLHGHWHRPAPSMHSAAPSTPVIRWRHGEVGRADTHARMHELGQAHEHAATDVSVVPLAPDTATEAVAQLGAALAPGADVQWRLPDGARHVLLDTAPWAAKTRAIAPPLKPPRA
jgi:hypothetical protein